MEWIFFDIGGTLADETKSLHRRAELTAKMQNKIGIHCTTEQIEEAMKKAASMGLPYFQGAVDLLGLRGMVPYDAVGEKLYGDVKPVLEALHGKYHLGIIANQPLGTEGRLRQYGIRDYFEGIGVPYVKFSDFTPNPLYEDVCKGVALFNHEKCDTIIAVGGGSSLDVAKCIKLYAGMDTEQNYLEQEYRDTGIPFIAVPTTAGTGSESTRYAVIYYQGQKQSVTHDSIVPDYAVLDHSVLRTLPLYQKKCTMLDALCQGIESWWSVNSTDESKAYSRIAVETIMKYKDAYLNDSDDEAAGQIMLASNYAGRAIHITQTTAAHAMSYKLTSTYGFPHGHAVAICLPELWDYMRNHLEACIDTRGENYLKTVFGEIEAALTGGAPGDAVAVFREMLDTMGIQGTQNSVEPQQLQLLAESVNPTRLKNNPIRLSEDVISKLYRKVLLR